MKKMLLLSFMVIGFITAFAQPPTISSFSPESGPVGTWVTINGTNFSPVPADNIVYFGAVKAAVVSASPTSLTVTAPKGATYLPISVTTNGLTGYANKPFIVTLSSCAVFDVNSFSGTPAVPTSTNLNGVAISDADGDGVADVIIVNQNANSISVYLNTSANGISSFATRVDFQTGNMPFDVQCRDLDGDGKPEIVVPNFLSNTVSVFRNRSTIGIIDFANKVDFQSGHKPGSIGIADFDNDGKLDLAVADSGAISILKNTSVAANISFVSAINLTGGGGNIGVGDFDGDEKTDIISNNVVFRNTGNNGTLAFDNGVNPGIGSSEDLAIGDFNGDNKPDLITISNETRQIGVHTFRDYGTYSVFKNNSTNNAIAFVIEGVGYTEPIRFTSVVIDDLNGDGKPDVALGTLRGMYVLRNISLATQVMFNYREAFDIGTISAGAIGDLNDDGKKDIISTSRSQNYFSVLINQINCAEAQVSKNIPHIDSFSPVSGPIGSSVIINGNNFSPVAADNVVYFGAVKAVVTAASGTSLTVTVPTGATYQPITVTTNGLTAYSISPFNVTFPNNGAGFSSNSFAPRVDFQTAANPDILLVGDIDGDNKPDIITGLNAANFGVVPRRVSVFRNIGFEGTVAFERVDINSSFITGIAIGDVDGDGKPDLAMADQRDISILKNKSTPGVVSFEQSDHYPASGVRGAIAIGDLDLDGKPDIVTPIFVPCANPDTEGPTISVLHNETANGIISFSPAHPYWRGCNFSTDGVSLVDFDMDGKQDVVGPDGAYRNVSTVGNIFLYPHYSSSRLTGYDGDFDGDGRPDLVTVRPDTVSVLQNLSSGDTISFTPKVNYPGGSGGPYAIADFDGDGKLDIAVANTNSNTFSVFRNQTSSADSCTSPTFLNNNQIVLDASCGKNDGNISIIPTSGTAPFMYSIDGGATYVSGPNAGYTFQKLAPGTYNLRLKDANGCESAVVQKTIKTVYGVPAFLTGNNIVLNASCGKSDGNISIIPTSGTGPFMYSIDGGATYVAGPGAGYTFNNLAPGTYQLRLKTASGCESATGPKEVKQEFNCPPALVSRNSGIERVGESQSRAVVITYPNPTKGQFKVQLQNFGSSKAEIVVFDAKGVQVQKRRIDLKEANSVTFDLSGRAPGLYYIKTISESGTNVSKIIVQ